MSYTIFPAVRPLAPAGDLVALARAFTRDRRHIDALGCLDEADAAWTPVTFGSAATWLVTLSALYLGLVLALEWGTKLEPFGAKLLMGRIVAIGVVREIGPVITGLMGSSS